jgi:transcriptional regulator with XRE-family HTH domain
MAIDTEEESFGTELGVLRTALGLSQKELAGRAGLTAEKVSRLERDRSRLTRELFEELAALMGCRPGAVEEARAFVARVQAYAAGPGEGARDEVREAIDALVARLERSAGELSRAWLDQLVLEGERLDGRLRAARLRARLFEHPPEARLALVREASEFQDWALSVLLSDESAAAAPDSAAEARALAVLAVEVARRVPGTSEWRSRVEGRAGAHLANALRVGGQIRHADEEFGRALALWEAGAAGDPAGLLDPVRMLDLEASLRKNQRRLGEALALLDRALATRPAPEVQGRLLINKGCALEKLERYEEAIEVLRQAAPLVEAGGDLRLRFAWRFNVCVALCGLGRHPEAESRLGEVRELANRIGKRLDLARVTWLEGRIVHGLGRVDEALAAFERVRGELTELRIAYDTALVTMDLATLLAGRGRTAEVKRLAEQAAWIFEDQGVDQEARRALAAFRRAARRERLTVDLARRIGRFLHRAQGDASLRFQEEAA